MDSFGHNQNLVRLRKELEETTDELKRRQLLELIEEEEIESRIREYIELIESYVPVGNTKSKAEIAG